jgi:hypothetical protein
MITRLSQLMIIGYADRRGPDDLPDIVLPVFAAAGDPEGATKVMDELREGKP